jgi:hypothetical protein
MYFIIYKKSRLHHFPKRGGLSPLLKSLNQARKVSGHVCGVLGVWKLPLSAIFPLYVGTVLTKWYSLFLI